MLSDLAAGIVIVLMSFTVKKGESRVGIAHGEIVALVRRKFFDDELFERRA
jgi:hypothetical protein